MGGTFSKKKREHQLRRNFVVTLVVANKRLKNTERFTDKHKDAMLKKMSWRKFGSQGTTLGADFLIEEAERHLKSGDLSGAAYSLLHVVRRNPNNNEAKLLLAKVFMSQGLPYKAEKLHEEILTDEPANVDALAAYGVLLGKHVKEYELAEQVLRLAVHERPQDRSLHILHLHAQELAHYAGPRGVALDSEEEPPPPKPIGAGPTRYGAMCEPPADQSVAWAERSFQDFESHLRETYVERYAQVLEEEQEGRLAALDVRMQPKVTDRGKANKLFCNYIDDKPTGLEAPFDVRRGNLVWPDEWYINTTVKRKEAMDEDTELSKKQVSQLVGIFQAAERKFQAEEEKKRRYEEAKMQAHKQPEVHRESTIEYLAGIPENHIHLHL
eukprot:Tamp_05775.p2 GENE.Tamp_05775~~Tamp_05775.p2  ORF type:complete len:383 (+),score=89.34 Tamp_05775:74-1222(+)